MKLLLLTVPPKKFYYFGDRFMREFMSGIAFFDHEFGMIGSGLNGFIAFYQGGFGICFQII